MSENQLGKRGSKREMMKMNEVKEMAMTCLIAEAFLRLGFLGICVITNNTKKLFLLSRSLSPVKVAEFLPLGFLWVWTRR